MSPLKFSGVFDTTVMQGWRGFAIRPATVRINGELKRIPVLAIYCDFSVKDEVKAFCKEHGGTWAAEPNKFWYCPLQSQATSTSGGKAITDEALNLIKKFRETVDSSLFLVMSGFYGETNEKFNQKLEKAIAKSNLSVVESTPETTEPLVENVHWVSEADEVEGTGDEGHYEGKMHFTSRPFPQTVWLHQVLPIDAQKRIKSGEGNEYREVLDTTGKKWYAEPFDDIGIWDDLKYSDSLEKFIKKV
jgi:hypothetical protein